MVVSIGVITVSIVGVIKVSNVVYVINVSPLNVVVFKYGAAPPLTLKSAVPELSPWHLI